MSVEMMLVLNEGITALAAEVFGRLS